MELQETTNYSIFKQVVGNRDLLEPHVLRLMASILQDNLLKVRPIIVNEKMEVIDGQHRIEAAKRLKLPVFYYIERGIDFNQMAQLNSYQKNWTSENFLKMYDLQGFPEYKKLNDFVLKSGVEISSLLRLFQESFGGGMRKFYDSFKEGKFKFNIPIEKLELYMSMYKKTCDLIVKNKFSGAKAERWVLNKSFFTGFIEFCKAHEESINWEIFFDHLCVNIDLVNPKATKEQYFSLLTKLYNWRLRTGALEEVKSK